MGETVTVIKLSAFSRSLYRIMNSRNSVEVKEKIFIFNPNRNTKYAAFMRSIKILILFYPYS